MPIHCGVAVKQLWVKLWVMPQRAPVFCAPKDPMLQRYHTSAPDPSRILPGPGLDPARTLPGTWPGPLFLPALDPVPDLAQTQSRTPPMGSIGPCYWALQGPIARHGPFRAL